MVAHLPMLKSSSCIANFSRMCRLSQLSSYTTSERNSNIWDQIANKGRLELIDRYFSSDFTFVNPTVSFKGLAEAKQYYGNLLGAFSDIEFIVEDAFQEGEKLAKRWIFRGTHTGELNGIPPTGKRATLVGATLARMVDGKIVEERDFADDLGFLQQLGVIPTLDG